MNPSGVVGNLSANGVNGNSSTGSTCPSALLSAATSARRRFAIGVCGRPFSFRATTALDFLLDSVTCVVEKIVLFLGPLLIAFASLIIAGLSWTFFTILLPMMEHKHQNDPILQRWIFRFAHVSMVFMLLVEICFNYFMCVTTRNNGKRFDVVVRELALATNVNYPETPQALELYRRDYEDRMYLRMKRRQQLLAQEELERSARLCATAATTGISGTALGTPTADVQVPLLQTTSSTPLSHHPTSTTSGDNNVKHRKGAASKKKSATRQSSQQQQQSQSQPQIIRSWMLMAPDEWGYCDRSKQPKPPRAHYDHVSKSLVLCLDHYCPWMFNSIGYFNYRYFCNFLWFVELAMIYGTIITLEPFMKSSGPLYRMQVQEYRRTGVWERLYPMVPTNAERLPISLSFMLCLAIGIAVACLGGFHLYLCLTGQTTIEFHANFSNRRKAARLQKKWKNPYDLGYRRNWQQVYGYSKKYNTWWKALFLLSRREPEFLPLPIPGDEGKRSTYQHRLHQEEFQTPGNHQDPILVASDTGTVAMPTTSPQCIGNGDEVV